VHGVPGLVIENIGEALNVIDLALEHAKTIPDDHETQQIAGRIWEAMEALRGLTVELRE
jgi:hypothetical protein